MVSPHGLDPGSVNSFVLQLVMHQSKKKRQDIMQHLGRRTCVRSSSDFHLQVKREMRVVVVGEARVGEGGSWGGAGREDQHYVMDNIPGRYFPNFLPRRWSVCTLLLRFWTQIMCLFSEIFDCLSPSP